MGTTARSRGRRGTSPRARRPGAHIPVGARSEHQAIATAADCCCGTQAVSDTRPGELVGSPERARGGREQTSSLQELPAPPGAQGGTGKPVLLGAARLVLCSAGGAADPGRTPPSFRRDKPSFLAETRTGLLCYPAFRAVAGDWAWVDTIQFLQGARGSSARARQLGGDNQRPAEIPARRPVRAVESAPPWPSRPGAAGRRNAPMPLAASDRLGYLRADQLPGELARRASSTAACARGQTPARGSRRGPLPSTSA